MPANISLSEKATRILDQFPGPVTLRPSRLKWIAYLAAFSLIAALSASALAVAVIEGDKWAIARALCLLLVGCSVVVMSAAALLTNYMALTLDEEGLEALYWYRRRRSSWKNVDGFEPRSIFVRGLRLNLVLFHDATRPTRFWYSLGDMNMRVPDTHRLHAAEDLARLLAAWRERALARRA